MLLDEEDGVFMLKGWKNVDVDENEDEEDGKKKLPTIRMRRCTTKSTWEGWSGCAGEVLSSIVFVSYDAYGHNRIILLHSYRDLLFAKLKRWKN